MPNYESLRTTDSIMSEALMACDASNAKQVVRIWMAIDLAKSPEVSPQQAYLDICYTYGMGERP